jgi:hypothetical protein
VTKHQIALCFLHALLISFALWVTGIVSVPFAAAAAVATVHALGIDQIWAHQIENLLYALGRVPVLAASLIALRIWVEE